MVEAEKVRESGLYIPDEIASKYQPDYGVVYDPGSCLINKELGGRVKKCRCPGCQGLKAGMLVGVKPYTGNWYTHKDFDWIPEGRIVKILGTVDDWTDNIPFYLEL
jgi:hypothetical protein